MARTCIYCTNNYSKDTEHVFPDGLGGQKVYMDCVCPVCNDKFSRLERELIQKSPVGLMRSVEGVGSLDSNGNNPYKASQILILDSKHGIAYEICQHNEMQVFLRPQVLLISDKFYVQGNSKEEIEKLASVFSQWKRKNLKLFAINPDDSVSRFQIQKKDNAYSHSILTEPVKTKNFVRILNVIPEDELFQYIWPRIFLTEDDGLCIRAKDIETALAFATKFLSFSDTAVLLRSFSSDPVDDNTIYVSSGFNNSKSERAYAKIGLNVLLHYFPESRAHESLAPIISYILNGSPGINAYVPEKSLIVDSCENSHAIFFYQGQTYLDVRVSLFTGHARFSFIISGLKILQVGTYNRFVVDYKNRTNTLQNTANFFASFNNLKK